MAVIYELPDGLTQREHRTIKSVIDTALRNHSIRCEYPRLRDVEGGAEAMKILAKKYRLKSSTVCQILYKS